MKAVTVVDYGCGNLRSVCRALEEVGATVTLSGDAGEVDRAERVVLPGVGSFAAGMAGLRARELDHALRSSAERKRILGICLGLQLLCDCGDEGGTTNGLMLINRPVVPLASRRVPHMGWADVTIPDTDDNRRVVGYVPGGTFYFAHSYRLAGEQNGDGFAVHDGEEFPACHVNEDGSIMGVQFHPEKSRGAGLHVLKAWLNA